MSSPAVATTPEVENMLARNAVVAIGVSGGKGLRRLRNRHKRISGPYRSHRGAPTDPRRPWIGGVAAEPAQVPRAGRTTGLGGGGCRA